MLGWQINAASNDILAQANQQPRVAIMTELETGQLFDVGQQSAPEGKMTIAIHLVELEADNQRLNPKL